jgi:hypothetical protein
MRAILIAILLNFLSFPANANNWASVAFTKGAGRLEIVKDYWIFSSGKSYDAEIPRRIQVGTRIRISYKNDGKVVDVDFDVAGISTKGELCRIHNKLPSRHSTDIGDTIYVKPCRFQ